MFSERDDLDGGGLVALAQKTLRGVRKRFAGVRLGFRFSCSDDLDSKPKT